MHFKKKTITRFYRVMRARYCYGKSSARPSVYLSWRWGILIT